MRCLGGAAYCIDQNNAGRLCVGSGDNLIRIEDPSDRNYSVILWKGIQARVTAVAWHPVYEDLIAYGTHDGKIGLSSTSSMSKAVILNTYHKGPVYELQWVAIRNQKKAPEETEGKEEKAEVETEEKAEQTFRLASCGGDGSLFLFDTKAPQKKPINLKGITKNALLKVIFPEVN